nr:immunoglobulin light chain junction region [Macaca mulatta]MOV62716.1 immunoglobulin light chain junction region [Macaca mulatta]
CLQHISSPYTF